MLNKIAVKNGIFAGVGTVAYLLLFYFISPRLMLSSGIIWSTLIIYLVFMYRATVQVRDRVDSFPIQLALRPPFIAYVVASLIYYAFYYLLFNVFDPGLLDIQYELMLEKAQRLADLVGAEQFKDQVEQISREDLQVTFRVVAFDAARSIIGGFLLSLILGALLRKEG